MDFWDDFVVVDEDMVGVVEFRFDFYLVVGVLNSYVFWIVGGE